MFEKLRPAFGPAASDSCSEKAAPSKVVSSSDYLGLRAAQGETAMSLTAEQRRALAMLATVGLDGASQACLMAHGFCVSMIVGLVNNGFATLTRETVRAGSRLIEVGMVRITAVGRKALIAERLTSFIEQP